MRLTLRVQHKPDETPIGFVSRLAKKNQRLPTRSFANDLRLDLQGIVDGDRAALEKVAYLAGADVTSLQAQALVRDADGYVLAGEKLQRSSLRRDRHYVCPVCLQNDLEVGGEYAPYQRTEWQVGHLRACSQHNIEMVELDSTHARFDFHDFALRLLPHLKRLGEMAAGAANVCRSHFETYIRGRLRKSEPLAPWLDAMELHAAARTSEIIGAVADRGIWPAVKNFDDHDWRRAAQVGFEITSGGETSIRTFLADLQKARGPQAHNGDGPQAWMGMLFDWASRSRTSEAYEPVRDVFFHHIVDTTPVKQGEVILGRTVERRRLHTLRSAHLEHKTHPKRLAKVLAASDIAARSDAGVLMYDADAAAKLIEKLGQSISLKDARDYLSADRVQTSLLHKHGFIRSITKTGGRLAFARSDLDRFLKTLKATAESVAVPPIGSASIPHAAKRANCTSKEIIQLVLDAKLHWTGQRSDLRGFAAILVDVNEIKSHVHKAPIEDALPARFIIKELKTNHKVVEALIANGHLKTETVVNPVNRCPTIVVKRAELNRFRQTFGSLFELAGEHGCHPLALKARLAKRGVMPALPPEKYYATFYRRADLVF